MGIIGAMERAQQPRVPAALAEDSDLIGSTCIRWLSVTPRDLMPSSSLGIPCTQVIQMDTYAHTKINF